MAVVTHTTEAFGMPAVQSYYEPDVREDLPTFDYIAEWEDVRGKKLITNHRLTTQNAVQVFRQIRLERLERGHKGYSLVDLVEVMKPNHSEPF